MVSPAEKTGVEAMSTPALTKTDILLLGLLLDRPMHGYELYQQIQSEGVDDWFVVSAAGVYYSLRKLHDLGLVVESRQRKRGTARKSIYRLTEKGRAAFLAAMEVELASREKAYLEYDLAISLLNRLPLERALPRLEERQAFLGEQAKEVQDSVAAERDNGSAPLRLAILDHKLRYLTMEQEWLAGVVETIQQEREAPYTREEERQGLMVLDGKLCDLHLPDLFHLILTGRHSGTLRVTDGAETRILIFEEGQPVSASALRRGEPMTEAASCEEVLAGLCELFCWREGRFSFDQRIEEQERGVALDCSAEELILRGCRKVDNWTTIQRLVPSADAIFELGPAARHLDRLSLTPTETEVVAKVDGVKDVATVARELDLTLFEASRAFYCLTAIGILHTADLDKIRLRRVFREIAELMCQSTHAWRETPEDRDCELEVNQRTADLPIHLDHGRVEDQVDPQLEIDELKEMYNRFLREQYKVVSRRFGQANARQSFERTLRQLAPELQDVAKRYGFDQVSGN
jgi:DNA-binding PadR family transcriptional regulator